jgi:hypothetical protein
MAFRMLCPCDVSAKTCLAASHLLDQFENIMPIQLLFLFNFRTINRRCLVLNICFVIGRSREQISTENWLNWLKYLVVFIINSRKIYVINSVMRRLLSNMTLLTHYWYSLIIISIGTIKQPEIKTSSLNEPLKNISILFQKFYLSRGSNPWKCFCLQVILCSIPHLIASSVQKCNMAHRSAAQTVAVTGELWRSETKFGWSNLRQENYFTHCIITLRKSDTPASNGGRELRTGPGTNPMRSRGDSYAAANFVCNSEDWYCWRQIWSPVARCTQRVSGKLVSEWFWITGRTDMLFGKFLKNWHSRDSKSWKAKVHYIDGKK